MSNYKTGLIAYIGILIVGFNAGYNIMQSCFFGGLTLVGLIALIESIKPLKWVMSRSSKIFDLVLFGFTIAATVGYGLTIAASLTVAGLGYTLFYGPYLRKERTDQANNKEPLKNHSNNFDWKK